MKVLMAVVSDLSTDARVRKQARTLREAGWNVEVIGFGRSPRAHVSVEDGITYRTYYLPASGALARPLRLMLIIFSLLRASVAILRSVADVYETHNMHLSLPIVLRARLFRVPVVYDAHEIEGIRHQGVVRWVVRGYERWLWRNTAVHITTNPSRAAHLRNAYGGSLPVVLNNFPRKPSRDVQPLNLRDRLSIPTGSPILIFQGGFYLKARDFTTVAAALAARPDWQWILVGFGSDATVRTLRELIDDAGITSRTHILPPVPVDDLLAYTAECDAGVVPLNHGDPNNYLGDTNKLFEYLVAGLAVVGTDFPEVRRAILDNGLGPVGAVYDTGDADNFARALDDVTENLATYRGRAWRLRDEFSWCGEEPKLLALFDAIAPPLPRA